MVDSGASEVPVADAPPFSLSTYQVRPPLRGSAALLRAVRLTRSLRSPYDHYMLRLHDMAKADAQYQASSPRREIAFGSGLRMGMLVHEFYDVGDRMLLEYLRHVDPALHKPFARGLGAAYRWRLLGSPPADLESYLRGYEALEG